MTQAQARLVTRWLVGGTVAVWIVWDIFAAHLGYLPTESATIRTWSNNWPILAYAAGVAGAHLWVNLPPGTQPRPAWAIWALILSGLVVLAGTLTGWLAAHLWPYASATMLVAGGVAGWMLWPQVASRAEGG